MSPRIEVDPLPGLPEVVAGDRIGALIADAADAARIELADDLVLAVSQKIVSKAEGRTRALSKVIPGERALALAAELGKDPRLVELILAESRRVVRADHGVLIVETNGGWVCANAGIDASNLPGEAEVSLLPADPDGSARRIRAEIAAGCDARPAILIVDSFGRPWRVGQAETAIGSAGLIALDDWHGRTDAHGRPLAATAIAVADQLAGAADLVRDKVSGAPVVVIAGAGRWRTDADGPGAAAALQRPASDDLFR
jgi:coenzyme F420-0:L-glutamate ligase / coenzyme F420-1:gamma-L-glutamate ligase